MLQRWDGGAAVVEPVAGLSPSVASVTLSQSGGHWVDYELRDDPLGLARLETEALLVHSAALIGCAERLIEITCEHGRNRVQFGVPIGSFQAVKHGLADAFTALAVAWNAILCAVAEGSDQIIAPLVARVLAVDSTLTAARAGAQFHGGMGFTAELNVHLFLKAILDGTQRFVAPDDAAVELGRRFAEAAC
jgi:alkylation response protein AidB-like acyl-CoA dehydrogenase